VRVGATLAAIAACLSAGMASASPTALSWSLLPQPLEARAAGSGTATIKDEDRVEVRGANREQLQPIADRFMQLVAITRGLHLQPARTTDAHPAISFELDARASVGEGGYRVVVGGQGIRVIASSPSGAFYGAVTVWQLLTPPGAIPGSPAEIAAGLINDRPHFAWRALLLDSGRHFQSVADIKKLIDWMSLEKLNVLLWHLTEDQGWRLEITKFPELTKLSACRPAVGLDMELTGAPDKPYCGFYSKAQVRDIVRYAAERFVTIVPEIDLPGHSQAAVAAYPWLGVTGIRPAVWTDWGVSPWLLKPGEKTLRFVDDVLDEVMQLFPSRYISIGGDEAEKQQWNASPELRAQLQKLGLSNMDELQAHFIGQIADHLLKHGRTPVGWDDELVAGAKLPENVVVMSWHGGDELRVALQAAQQGHDVILTPETSLYFDHYQTDRPDEGPGQPPMATLRQAYDTALVPKGATDTEARHVIGVQGDLWTELMPNFARDAHALYPRLAALAELGWSAPNARDWNGFLQRLSAELARYRALGIDYADTPFAPTFEVRPSGTATLRVTLSNQVKYGEIRYTTDGSFPASTSTLYVAPLAFPAASPLTLRAATFGPGEFELAAPRAQQLGPTTLLSRQGGELASCSGEPAMRLNGRDAQGMSPVYATNVGNMCWLWRGAPIQGMDHITLSVERLAWRFGDEAKDAIVRPKAGAAGEFEVHADSCAGPLLASLPLSGAAQGGQSELHAQLSTRNASEARDLCFLATGDPREGQWVLGRVAMSKSG
jgi:hexosaminidase